MDNGPVNIVNNSINYKALKKAEKILVDNIDIPKYFSDFVVPRFEKYKKPGINKDLKTGPVLCPFHKEAEPSFHYVAKQKYYNCFSCQNTKGSHSGGNVVHLHKEILILLGKIKTGISEAVQSLAKEYNILIPDIEIVKEDTVGILDGLKSILNESEKYTFKHSTKINIKTLIDLRKNSNYKQCILIDNVYALIKSGHVVEKQELMDLLKTLEDTNG